MAASGYSFALAAKSNHCYSNGFKGNYGLIEELVILKKKLLF